MPEPFRIFQRSGMWTQCEECNRTLDLMRLGACTQCRRTLCNDHLHGSFARRLLVDLALGVEPVCLRCRATAAS